MIVLLLLVIVIIGYIWLMACFEEPISFDASDQIVFRRETCEIELPWYHRIYTEAYGKLSGIDSEGNEYTKFYYDLPDIFESAEMTCVVSWKDETAKMYIGESRAMEIIDVDFPLVNWSRYYY